MMTCYDIITLHGQSLGHQGLQLPCNDLIRKEKEDTGEKEAGDRSAALDSLAALPGDDIIDPQ